MEGVSVFEERQEITERTVALNAFPRILFE